MGSGARAERIAFGTTAGQLTAQKQFYEQMIPIWKKEAEMDLEIQKKTFAQQFEQTEKLSLLQDELDKKNGQQPIYISAAAEQAKPPNYILYVGLAIAAILFLRRGKK